MSSPASTPRSNRTRRGKSADPETPSRRSTRSSATNTPTRRRKSADKQEAIREEGSELAPLPLSPPSGVPDSENDNSLFSSPAPSRRGGLTEVDLSSPLHYGTPSSRVGDTPTSMNATPVRHRFDIRSERRMRQVNLASGGGGSSDPVDRTEPTGITSDHGDAPQLVIWGTDVVVQLCKDKFKQFITHFVDPEADSDERMVGRDVNEPLYLQRLEEINALEEPFLNVNSSHLNQFDADLYRQLICYPQEVIPTFDMAVNELFFSRYPNTQLEHQIQVRPYNVEKTVNMRSLNPEDIDQLITISGMVIRTSSLVPEMREAFFRCYCCSNSLTVEIDRGRIAEPTLCRNCSTNHSFALIHNRSQFTDKQMVKLQESPGWTINPSC